MKMIFYIDGDNSPGTRIEGMSKLGADDIVKIFYASNNKYYTLQENRDSITAKASCKVSFVPVPHSADAVDFAIAIHAAHDCATDLSTQVICLVSGDNHFKTIEKELHKLYGDKIIKKVETVEEGIMRFFMVEVKNLDTLRHCMDRQFGTKISSEIYRRLKICFQESRTEKVVTRQNRLGTFKKINILEKLKKTS